jgi:DNA-binding transcriptional regulator GbsR (MarR family)
VWDIFFVILEERKRRELDPTLTTLRECVMESEEDPEIDPVVKERIEQTLQFLEQITGWYAQMKKMDRASMLKMIKIGIKIQSLLNPKG